MKNFLTKKPVMITFLAVAVAFLALYVYMLVRPVSYGMAYTTKETEGTSITKISLKFKSSKVVRMTTKTTDGNDKNVSKQDIWVYVDGQYAIMPIDVKEYIEITGSTKEELAEANEELMTKEEYKELVKELKEEIKSKEDWEELVKEEDAYKLGTFSFKVDTGDGLMTYTCKGAIAFAIVGGIIEVALLGFGGVSTYFFIKSKKQA